MCLSKLVEHKGNRPKFGYKRMQREEPGRYTNLYKVVSRGFEVGKVYKARRTTIRELSIDGKELSYVSGFHMFARKKEILKYYRQESYYKLVKVRIPDTAKLTYGEQWGCKMIVASEMEIVGEIR